MQPPGRLTPKGPPMNEEYDDDLPPIWKRKKRSRVEENLQIPDGLLECVEEQNPTEKLKPECDNASDEQVTHRMLLLMPQRVLQLVEERKQCWNLLY